MLDLLAAGGTDSDIAARLFISVRTVRSHLDRIRDKTGCRRRSELTRLAIELEQASTPGDQPDGLQLRSTNLPRLASSFVGRQAELSELRRLVVETRLVTLTGPGGVGKTRLGLRVAEDLLDGSGEGVWLVELAPLVDPEAVAGAVASALGVKEQPGRSSINTLVHVLADMYVLVVLDNCEHVIGACAKLAEAVLRSCPRVHPSRHQPRAARHRRGERIQGSTPVSAAT